jgi:hypothetical protein
MRAAAIQIRPDPVAARCSKMVQQVGHGAISTVQGDKFVAAVRRLPINQGKVSRIYFRADAAFASRQTPVGNRAH